MPCVLTFTMAQNSIDSLKDSKGLVISTDTFLLAASIDDDTTHSLSGPLGYDKAKSFFLTNGLKILQY